ncbi:DUF1311 domain-containing protein [Caproiciproducens galactitolivorans]|uniref:Lysozyme inhibitor LprI-like N-terminal domain-containing protein n=1 Tax=Caproiciproducens galactitolivorans TaxID=642589 RepID=A0A4Z0YDB9_9FIRM|nr:lysozyme inhibitor LprI family protein [Caproiciproducens galactitolivorans]QEY35210.1 DUF1311 domain-containing protein [Caproiciproducens galactitolivorans]TGJ76900.1 hypothetical protein CAGA_09730 [Caproiciproducens galactitolivorans]
MKNRKILCAVLAFALAASVFAACGSKKGGESSVPASSFAAESLPAVSSEVSSESASSDTVVVTSNEPAESQPGPVVEITTDNKEFDELFKKNPIDKKYIQELNDAISNVAMVNLSNKYTGIWEKEVSSAYKKLCKLAKGSELTKIKDEQTAWENGKSAALKKISDDAQAAGGSMAQVNAASATMDFYRSRAAQLYRALYSYDPNYSYAYNSK